ncbi:MAG: SCO family protein [Gemmataceae bacterium]|nr:SCO family protein [Gemmataceae bacterium]
MSRSLLFLMAVLVAGCAAPSSTEEPLLVPDFKLTERSGKDVSKADLDGKVWIAACIFTRCTTSCPQVSGVMARLQKELSADVTLVSFSADPKHDAPEVLSNYAKRFGADPERWLFLTGDTQKVYEFIQKGLRLGVMQNQGTARTPGNEVEHSSRLVLVDRKGRIRGFHETRPEEKPDEPKASTEEKIDELKRQVNVLLREKR